MSQAVEAPARPPYPPPAELPTQLAPHGIRFDFNLGCRIALPPGNWHVRLRDLDSGNLVFATDSGGGTINSRKRHYVRFCIEVSRDGVPVWTHDYDAADRVVAMQFPVGTLGDVLGWLPYAVRFGEVHGCRLVCAMAETLIPLFAGAYPNVAFVTHDAFDREAPYASYCLGLFFDDDDGTWQPTDFRLVGLHRTAGYILGVDPAEEPPRLALPDVSRPIPDPYVCIAAQSSTQAKYWNNPTGWYEVVAFLKEHGYRVVCIDQRRTHGNGIVWNHIPYGAEDQTGDRPLAERARWLRHAAFFVGLSSGLSWLAWAAGTPVVLISGFTHPTNEFATPYRVVNWHACNSCWNDVRVRFDHKDFFWCPRHAGTPRQFECTRLITAAAVTAAIRRIPGFGQHRAETTLALAAE
ncbi:MAG: autotransporter strand-loop-strand O-heptosyltransferase [Acetobacteraceae bacterium]|nr:autotransporter strand-loop-strand O-heptosyltransferase [Acetobacteraceae bacterium]